MLVYRFTPMLIVILSAGLLHAADLPESIRDRLPRSLRPPFHWQASEPIFRAPVGDADEYFSLKDPSIIFHQGMWHLFCTVRARDRSHQIQYLQFPEIRANAKVERHFLSIHPGFYCAPQVFYFRPQQKWYLICQASSPEWTPEYGPAFSTTEDISDSQSWSQLASLRYQKPTSKAGLDFWVICDHDRAHLFFTSLDGRMWREETRLADFPHGWSKPVVALEADVFEASHTYRILRTDLYLTVIEAQHAHGARYYKAYVAEQIEGPWYPLADRNSRSFADRTNVLFQGESWTDSISHGELLRSEYDERMAIEAGHLRFLFQGVSKPQREGKPYGQYPWRLGLLTPAGEAKPESDAVGRGANHPMRAVDAYLSGHRSVAWLVVIEHAELDRGLSG